MSEMIIILAVALLVFGPTKLPEIAKGIAKGLRELRRASDDLRSSVDLDLDDKPRYRPPTPAAPPRTDPPPQITGSALATAAVATEATGTDAPADKLDDATIATASPTAITAHAADGTESRATATGAGNAGGAATIEDGTVADVPLTQVPRTES